MNGREVENKATTTKEISLALLDKGIQAMPRASADKADSALRDAKSPHIIGLNQVIAAYIPLFFKQSNDAFVIEDKKREEQLGRSIATLLKNAFRINQTPAKGEKSSFEVTKFGFTDSYFYCEGTTKRNRGYSGPADGSAAFTKFCGSVPFATLIREDVKLMTTLNAYTNRRSGASSISIGDNGFILPPEEKLQNFLVRANKNNNFEATQLREFFNLCNHFIAQLNFLKKHGMSWDKSIYDQATQSEMFYFDTDVFKFEYPLLCCPTGRLGEFLLALRPYVKPEDQQLWAFAAEAVEEDRRLALEFQNNLIDAIADPKSTGFSRGVATIVASYAVLFRPPSRNLTSEDSLKESRNSPAAGAGGS